MRVKKRIWLSKANEIVPLNTPIVFWDTCALVDIVRTARRDRDNLNHQVFEKYKEIADWIYNGHVTSATSEVVAKEFSRHFNIQKKEIEDQTSRIKDEVKELSLFMSNASKSTKIRTDIDYLEAVRETEATTNKIWRNTIVVKKQDSFMHFADFRVTNYMSPSGGKESYKDSYIWATFLYLANKLDTTEQFYFFTTNKKDFDIVQLNPLDLSSHPNKHLLLNVNELYGNLHTILTAKGLI